MTDPGNAGQPPGGTPGTPPPAPPAPPADPPPADPPGTGEDSVEGLKSALAAERKKAREGQAATRRATELEAEVERLKAAGQTEAEKALEAARKEAGDAARAEERQSLGAKLARSAFDAAAGRRNPDLKAEDIDGILELVDLTKLLDESGDPDPDAVAKAVERLVAEPQQRLPGGGFDLGNRGGGAQQYGDTPDGHLSAGIAEALGGGGSRR